jgi:hypothetical protein
MTTTTKYIPSSDADKGIWINNFTTKMNGYATNLGVTPAELTALQKDNAAFQYIINTMESYRQYVLNLAGYKNMMKHASLNQHIGTLPAMPTLPAAPPMVAEGIFDRIGKMVTRIKASLNYTDNIGSDLGVIAASSTINISTLQPEINIKVDVGKAHLKWVKGIADGIDLYADRNDEQGYVYVGRLSRNEYLDITPMAANKVYDEWHYKGIFVIADQQVGLYSVIKSIDLKKL